MTREAKIGMLTGLGVIIVIGGLLSEYLGDPSGAPKAYGNSGGSQVATGKMADLPVSKGYRDQMTEPVAVPGMTPMGGDGVPVAFAAMPEEQPQPQAGPVLPLVVAAVNPEVTERWAGVASDAQDVGPQTFMLMDNVTPGAATKPAAKPVTKTVVYTIAAGDNLGKIAKKFYNSSKASDLQKIINANKGTLKDASSTLVAGKTLNIPEAVQPAKPAQVVVDGPVTGGRVVPGPGVYIHPPIVPMPGDLHGDTHVATSQPSTVKAKTYTVQDGDTLEKIAKKMSPKDPTAYVEKLKLANSIKDPRSLQVSQTLKLPA